MRTGFPAAALAAICFAGAVSAAERGWENPVFDTVEEAVAAARSQSPRLDRERPAGLRLFVDMVLAEGDLDGHRSSSFMTRRMVDDFLITHPTAFGRNLVQRRTIDRFLDQLPRQQRVLEGRLARFGFPAMPGLVYLRLVDDVDAFADLNRASSDRMSRVGGVTYYCRYVVLPLSYVGEENLRELRRAAALNPSLNVDDTIRSWQRESFANLVNTFRHELVHVHTNSTIDVPGYSDRAAYPTWFHEGTATYLAADPHASLSASYQQFQRLFFYLVQRHGVDRLRAFYTEVLGGSDVESALDAVYAIAGAEQLFARSGRWHRVKGTIKSSLWIVALTLVIAAIRGTDLPLIGSLQLLVGASLGLGVAGGFAEHLYGLRGPSVVLTAKLGLGLAAAVLGLLGVRRLRLHRRRQTPSSE